MKRKEGIEVLETSNQKVFVGMTGEKDGKFYVGLRDVSVPAIQTRVSMHNGDFYTPEGNFFAIYFTLPDADAAEAVADTLEEMVSDLRQAINERRRKENGYREILYLD